MPTNYWIWDDNVTSEDQAYMDRLPPEFEKHDMVMDSGRLITASIPDPVDVLIKNTRPYSLTDSIVGPAARCLVLSTRLQHCLAACGIENLQYFPCRLLDADGQLASDDYSIINIVGRVQCIDFDASDVALDPFSSRIAAIESLTLDESRIPNLDLFRLDEASRVIVASTRIVRELSPIGFTGVTFIHPSDYML